MRPNIAKVDGSKAEGQYIARTDNEATLSIPDICTTSINRGGFTDNYDEYVEHVTQFMEEAVYQLLDGYAVNFGYFSLKNREKARRVSPSKLLFSLEKCYSEPCQKTINSRKN